ncbi:MAG TPA: tyrosine-type recombinase/integrase [Bacillota bacterium]|nr:tyrosine-type recombinase/integrase [Bacillota bacterium]
MKFQKEFEDHLSKTKRMAAASRSAYLSDMLEFSAFAAKRGKEESEVGNSDVAAFLLELKQAGKSSSTVNRKLASIRCYYRCLMELGVVASDPTAGIKSPRIQRSEIEYLSLAEVETLLSSPDESVKGIRDRALLELMYATGVRSGELVGIKLGDLNMKIGFVSCTREDGRVRMIPVGRPAREALERYIGEARPSLVARSEEDDGSLFVNYNGSALTRQGVWKIIKYYGEKSGLGEKINPQILRNSFAAHMVQNGADLKSLQELMGYEDIMATKIFVSLTKNRIIDVYDRTHPRA